MERITTFARGAGGETKTGVDGGNIAIETGNRKGNGIGGGATRTGLGGKVGGGIDSASTIGTSASVDTSGIGDGLLDSGRTVGVLIGSNLLIGGVERI